MPSYPSWTALVSAYWGLDSYLQTSVPFGQVTTSTNGHCAANACLNASCYDWGTLDNLDNGVLSIASPGGFSISDPLSLSDLINNGNLTEASDYVQNMVDSDPFDFYDTLETFACCDCDGCMRLSNCYQNLVGVQGNVSCADVWEFLLPTTNDMAEMSENLNVLNVGGCYWCPSLLGEVTDSVVGQIASDELYDFPIPTPGVPTFTTIPQPPSTAANTTTTPAPGLCANLGCTGSGAVDETCSCLITCQRDEAATGLPCCEDYADVCPEICPKESFEVDDSGHNTLDYVGYYGSASSDAFERFSCDDIISLYGLSDAEHRFTCNSLENLYGLNCDGCDCYEHIDSTTSAPSNCSDVSAECGFGWKDPMSCDSLIEASRQTLFAFPDQLQSHLTCATLEDIGCDCTGCMCERNATCAGQVTYDDTGTTEVLCMGGESCDYWVKRLPNMTCDVLESDYGCNCNYCDCAFEMMPEPEETCECKYTHTIEDPSGAGGLIDVTCDDLSAMIQPDGLCCGVMEYAFQMDCSGCCCNTTSCDKCVDNSTTTTTTTTTTTSTTTTTTTTTLECPDRAPFYSPSCDSLYTFDCYTGVETLPRTDAFKRFYSCEWIDEYLSGNQNCFATATACTDNTDCNNGLTCLADTGGDLKCHLCPTDSIPGGEEGSGDPPCYFLNHPGNSAYTAYDCVNDYRFGGGCIYFNETDAERTESFCTIEIGEVVCDPPPDCDEAVCYAQVLATGGCSTSCGATGSRATVFTCEEEQTGALTSTGGLVDCGMGDNETLNCVSRSPLIDVGYIDVGPCNRFDCPGQVECYPTRAGDGLCDWTDQANYEVFFQDAGLLSVNNNLEACNWDGGDCCAYTCDQTDETPNDFSQPTGVTCAWGGGGCQRVPIGIASTLKSDTSYINPGGLATLSPGVDCVPNVDGTFNCCADMILYDGDLSPLVTENCVWGDGNYDNCATQGFHCLDPGAPSGNATTSAP